MSKTATYTIGTGADWENPYVAAGRVVNEINFFKDSAVVANHHCGWVSTGYSSNRCPWPELEAIEVCARRNITTGLLANKSFVVREKDGGVALYINVDELPGFEYLGERQKYDNGLERSFQHFFRVIMDGKQQEISLGRISRVERTARGQAMDNLDKHLTSLGINLTTVDLGRILDNASSITEVLATVTESAA